MYNKVFDLMDNQKVTSQHFIKENQLAPFLTKIDPHSSINPAITKMPHTNSIQFDTECHQFDTECHQRYGEKTCILHQIDSSGSMFQVRILDKGKSLMPCYTVERNYFHILIPKMLAQKYTVVIIEQVDCANDITAVHLPVQVQLSNPPIIQ